MVANRQERERGRQHRECSRVDRISCRTNDRRKRTKSGSNTSVVPVSYSCRTKIVQAVLDRQRSGVKATMWWFCHDYDRSGRSAMIGNIGKEWSAQCDLGFTRRETPLPGRCAQMFQIQCSATKMGFREGIIVLYSLKSPKTDCWCPVTATSMG